MKFKTMMAVALLMALAATPALATHWETFVAQADCEGWSAEGGIVVRSTLESVEVTYLVQLMQDGVVVQEQTGQATVMSQNPFASDYYASGMWEGELCGDYTVEGVFEIVVDEDDTVRNLTAAFTCDCPPPDACHFTPGYWKNHEENWPVATLALGGISYTQEELLEVLATPVRGDATIILAYHLIAAKLNVLNGADDSIQDAIDEADALLAGDAPLFSKPSGDLKNEVLMVKDELCAYNEMGCPDDHVMEPDFMMGMPVLTPDSDELPDVDSTWGAIKDRFR